MAAAWLLGCVMTATGCELLAAQRRIAFRRNAETARAMWDRWLADNPPKDGNRS